MITKQTILKYVCVIGLGFALNVGCSSDDSGRLPEVPELPEEGDLIEGDGISEDELETFMGEIGILLDARPYIRKGQPITKLRVTPTDSDYFEPMVLEVDPFTNYASFKFALENLSSEAETALRNGIDLEVDLLDENDNELFKEILENTLFTENGSNVELRGDGVEDLNTEVHLNPDTPYFLQLVTDDGQIESKALDNEPNLVFGDSFANGICTSALEYQNYPSLNSEADFSSNNTTQQFYFQKHEGEENVYSIISRHSNRYLAFKSIFAIGFISKEVYTSEVNKTDDYTSLSDAYKFQIRKENGTYQLAPYSDDQPFIFKTTTRNCTGLGIDFETTILTSSFTSGAGQNFRFATTDVEYEAQSIETWYGQPILPGAENSFKVNSTLTNCTSAVISQDVGVDLTETKTMSVSWQETIGLTAGATLTTEITVGTKAGVSFFGKGNVEASGEVSVGLELSVEMSKSATNAEEKTTEIGSTIFTKRVVPVNPGKQVLVYDAVQTYPAIRVPFVQRIKITGRNSDQVALTGEELATQSAFGGFTGTITEIGTNSIEITVRGMTTFDNTAEIQLEASETDADCN
ncbi:hypothetical protein ACFSQJ_11380 [Croceitalea marina]|uniref:Uncharacterized protein n=1 Tax=Croceitalea marina TaxID=1775166 RepID=A0ABW5MYL7_9FLAO